MTEGNFGHWRPARSGLRVGGNRVPGAQVSVPDDPGGDSRTRGMAVGGAPFGGFPATEPGLSAGSRFYLYLSGTCQNPCQRVWDNGINPLAQPPGKAG